MENSREDEVVKSNDTLLAPGGDGLVRCPSYFLNPGIAANTSDSVKKGNMIRQQG